MNLRALTITSILLIVVARPLIVFADAIVVSQAMFASTIAEYFAPMAGFIYVEPFEVRKEIIVRPADVQRSYDLGLEGVDVITSQMQASVKAGIVDYLDEHFKLTIDGQAGRYKSGANLLIRWS